MPETETHPRHLEPDNGGPINFTTRRPWRARITSGLRSWRRDTFSRESLSSSLRSLAWVAPLTVLIWIYAEREQVVQIAGAQVIVAVRSTEPTRVARLLGPDGQPVRDATVKADLKGPQSGIDKLRDSLGMGPPITLDIDQTATLGINHIPAQLINNAPQFKATGVSVSNVMPHELTVWVDTIRDEELDVEAPPEVKNLTGRPIFVPAKVRVSGPSSVLEQARRQGRLHAYADLKTFKELDQPGRRDLTGVPVNVRINDPDVRVIPPTVSAQVEVRKQDKLGIIPYVRIAVTTPLSADAKRYDVVPIDDQGRPIGTLPNVPVIGPEEIVNLLVSDKSETKPTASFEPDFSEPDKEKTAPLEYKLPDKVQPAPPGPGTPGAPTTIRYRIERRTEQ